MSGSEWHLSHGVWRSGAGTSGIVALFESAVPPSCSLEAQLRADTLVVYDEPLHGSATVVDGAIVYTPEVGFFGLEVFSYLVCTDAPFCGTALVEVSVEQWGTSLRHPSRVPAGNSLRLWVKAGDAPPGVDLRPLEAATVEIDCVTGEPIGEFELTDTHSFTRWWRAHVRWPTDEEWDGCRRLRLTFGDGSTADADVTMVERR